MLTLVHSNPARLENGVFTVDRKFHHAMRSYVRGVRDSILSVHPQILDRATMMDPIEVPCADLGYTVMILNTDRSKLPFAGERERLREVIRRSQIVCGGALGSAELADKLGVPYILFLEYDLETQIRVAMLQVSSRLRRAVRAVRCTLKYVSEIPLMRRAAQLHCAGYPIFDDTKRFNDRRLIYLESRMSADMVIPEAELRSRLSSRAGRPLRLLYSGRYEPMKGADDAVRVALACLRRGIDIEMHCYGRGSLRDEMRRLASEAPQRGRIFVHDAVPGPELAALSRSFDIFVCCHVQSDPSATYVESFGSGLPIVGYGNRMWRRLCEVSGAGISSPLRQPEALAARVQNLMTDASALDAMSIKARQFALDHTFEREFGLRIDAINSVLDESRNKPSPA